MFLPLFLILALGIMGFQLLLCVRVRNWLKMLPLGLLLAGELVCWGVRLAAEFVPLPEYSDFAAYIYGLLLLLFLGADLLAWGIYAIGRKIKRK